MPLTPQILPLEERVALQRDLRHFKSVDASTADSLLAAAQSDTLGHITEVFTFGVQDVLDGQGVHAATSAGWRLAAFVGPRTVACDMYTVARGGEHPLPQGSRRLSCVRTGDPIKKQMSAIDSLESIDGQSPATPFFMRLLVLPAFFTDALWLLPENLNLAGSKLVPYDTLIKSFKPGTQYSPEDFIQRLLPVAEYWKYRPPTPVRTAPAAGSRTPGP